MVPSLQSLDAFAREARRPSLRSCRADRSCMAGTATEDATMKLPDSSHPSMSRLLAAALLIPLLAACGGSAATPSRSASASASAASSAGASTAPSDAGSADPSASGTPGGTGLLLACAPTGPGWKASALNLPATAETGSAAAAKALKEYVTGPDGGDLPDTGWQELYRSKDVALYGQPDPSGQPDALLVATIRATDGNWAGEDSGQCRPRTWLGSTLGMAATWKVASKPSSSTKTLKLSVTEQS